jgi:D-arabinose 5-phosphate isomerase GutQ
MKKTKAKTKKTNPQTLINLDECVLNALNLLASSKGKLPRLQFDNFKRPLVVGSGNAAITGKIIFSDQDAVFANESTYQHALQTIKAIDGVILISASGGKHAPEIANYLNSRKKKLPLILLTCNKNAEAKKYVDRMIVFPHNPEPYTYNTSTYMGMILAKTKENPLAILRHIKRVVEPILKSHTVSFANYDAFFLLVPENLDLIKDMLRTKFVELFGRKVARDIFTWEQAKHATTVVPYDTELFISFGRKNNVWGKHRLYIPLPKNANYGAIMAIGYYVIGKIQAQKPPFFKDSIATYCRQAKKWFDKELPVIVKYD